MGYKLKTPQRADLQGMRAIAVLAVIAYHFHLPGASGGFVGVDVFFVLSGFFITRLLYRDIVEHGYIRLGQFWANRAKRLLPNGMLVIACILIAAALFFPAYRLPGLAEDARAAAVFFANFHFEQRAVDYFHLDDPASPLLHFWSLAIEEQFYLGLPLLMTALALALRRRKSFAIISLLILVIGLSTILSLIAIDTSQPAAFYFPWNRAWQLASGGFIGMVFESRNRVPGQLRSLGAVAGLITIILCIVLYTDDLLYPGLWALAPTLGAGAVIYGLDAGNSLQRILALRPMAWIGDISYSLYLWHWPVAIFGAEFWPQNDPTFIVGGLILTFLLAMSAYYFVERPIHHMEPSKPIAGLTIGALGVGLLSGAASGLPMLAPPVNAAIAERIAAATADLGANYNNGCHLGLKETMQPDCRFGHIGGPRVVLFGDSHAAQWFTPLVKAAEESGWELNAWTKTSCPTSDVIIWYPGTRAVYEECDTWRKSRYSDLRANPPELIIIGNFNNYYGWLYDKDRGRAADRSTSEHLWQVGMARTAEALTATGLRVVELRDTPRMYASYKNCLSNGDWNVCTRPRDEALSGMDASKIQSSLYSRLDFTDALCSPQDCPAAFADTIAYHDSHHLTATQAALLYHYFLPLLTSHR